MRTEGKDGFRTAAGEGGWETVFQMHTLAFELNLSSPEQTHINMFQTHQAVIKKPKIDKWWEPTNP